MRYFISKIKIPEVVKDDYYNRLLITTHSPYILTSLNNLMYGYVTGQQHFKETNDVISSKYWMNPDDVSAYMLLPNGKCEDIFNREENLIKAEKIDEVSTKINREFNKLINIELGIANEDDK
jgi:mRNA-degrading endonuclease HigB of HigAB toxin-antitoxin module